MKERKRQSLLNGALILVMATVLVKIIGVLFKIPITNLITTTGRGYFDSAYNIFLAVYNVAMAGLPVAISKLVAQNVALGRYRDVKQIFRIGFRLFFITGTLGTILLLILAKPYAISIKEIDTIPSILVIAPSIFFCCIMSTYRGYYAGLRNMTPTAVSQVIEALSKLILGLLFASFTMNFGMKRFEQGKTVFGKIATEKPEALAAIYPYAAAAAIAGITIGTIIALGFLIARHKFVGDGITRLELRSSPSPLAPQKLAKVLVAIAVPVLTSAIIMNITNLIDAWSIQFRLEEAIDSGMPMIREMYATAFAKENILDEKIKMYLYGSYSISLDFKNLLPALTMTLGVSAIPVLSEAWTLKNKNTIKVSIESVIRVVMMLSLPAGIGMAVLSQPIINMLYSDISSATIAAPILAAFGYSAFLISISQPLTNMLQAIGRMDIPVKTLAFAAAFKIGINFILVANPKYNIKGAAIGTIVFYLIIVVLNVFFLIKESGVRPNLITVFVKPLFCSILCGMAAWSAYGLLLRVIPEGDVASRINGNTFSAVLAIGIAVLVYGLSLLFTKAIVKDDLKMLPKGEKIAKTLEKYGFIG